MYAKGMSTWDIQAHIEKIYGIELSPSMISHITEKMLEAVREWQSRPPVKGPASDRKDFFLTYKSF